MFTNCFDVQEIPIGPYGPTVVNFTVPVATDNSGIPPSIQVKPYGLKPPYNFTKV